MKYRTITVAISLILLSASTASAGIYTIAPHISISEEYTDNRNMTDTNQIEEYTTTISPGINQSIVTKRVSMNLDYTAGYVQYNETDADPIWNHNATLDFRADLSKHTQLSIADSFTRTDQPLRTTAYNIIGYVQIGDRLIPVADTTLLRGRKQYDTNSAFAALTRQFGEQDSFSLHYSHNYIKELESEFGVDNQQHTSGIDLTYWLTPQFGVNLSARYTLGEIENSDDYSDGKGEITLRRKLTRHFSMNLSYDQTFHRYNRDIHRDYDLYKSSVGFSYNIDKSSSLTLGGGYFYQEMKETGNDDEGPFADISIRKSWTSERSSVNLSGNAGLSTNNFGSENLGLNRNYGFAMGANYKITKRMDININTAFSRHVYLELDDLTWNRGMAGFGLRFTPWQWLSISASYSFIILDSTRETDDYEENTAMLSISIFPGTYRNNY